MPYILALLESDIAAVVADVDKDVPVEPWLKNLTADPVLPDAALAVIAELTYNGYVVTILEPTVKYVARAFPKVGVVNVGEVNVLFVNVSVPANVASVPVVGNVIFVAAVLVNVEAKPPDIANEALVGIVNVPSLPVIDKPFIVVAVASPNIGVVNDGDTKFANVPVTVGKVNETPAEL